MQSSLVNQGFSASYWPIAQSQSMAGVFPEFLLPMLVQYYNSHDDSYSLMLSHLPYTEMIQSLAFFYQVNDFSIVAGVP